MGLLALALFDGVVACRRTATLLPSIRIGLIGRRVVRNALRIALIAKLLYRIGKLL